MSGTLSKADYEEPRCLLNMHPEIARIPIGRILEKLDRYLEQKDFSEAERHLAYWRKEAEDGNDLQGKLTILNELIGLYRKTGKEAECLQSVSDALSLADSLEMGDTITGGTTLVNAATGYKAFGRAKEALPLYRKAKSIYESRLEKGDRRLAGLYNNMALALSELKEYGEARELYRKAAEIMEAQENGEPDAAVTWLNLADLTAAEKGLEAGEKEIDEYLSKAERLLDTEGLARDGYYAFVCEKCAPVFGYYGYFLFEQELKRRAEKFYERA